MPLTRIGNNAIDLSLIYAVVEYLADQHQSASLALYLDVHDHSKKPPIADRYWPPDLIQPTLDALKKTGEFLVLDHLAIKISKIGEIKAGRTVDFNLVHGMVTMQFPPEIIEKILGALPK
jgi:hypothetical protein